MRKYCTYNIAALPCVRASDAGSSASTLCGSSHMAERGGQGEKGRRGGGGNRGEAGMHRKCLNVHNSNAVVCLHTVVDHSSCGHGLVAQPD